MTKNKDIEKLIVDFQSRQPSTAQLQRWRIALSQPMAGRGRSWYYAAAGMAAGLILGMVLSREFTPSTAEENFSATYVLYDVKNL